MDSLDKIAADLTSLHWWVTVVVVGLVVNVLSSLLMPAFDRCRGRRSEAYAQRRAQEQADYPREVELLADQPNLIPLAVNRELRWRLMNAVATLMTLLVTAISRALPKTSAWAFTLAFALAFLILSFYAKRKAWSVASQLNGADCVLRARAQERAAPDVRTQPAFCSARPECSIPRVVQHVDCLGAPDVQEDAAQSLGWA